MLSPMAAWRPRSSLAFILIWPGRAGNINCAEVTRFRKKIGKQKLNSHEEPLKELVEHLKRKHSDDVEYAAECRGYAISSLNYYNGVFFRVVSTSALAISGFSVAFASSLSPQCIHFAALCACAILFEITSLSMVMFSANAHSELQIAQAMLANNAVASESEHQDLDPNLYEKPALRRKQLAALFMYLGLTCLLAFVWLNFDNYKWFK